MKTSTEITLRTERAYTAKGYEDTPLAKISGLLVLQKGNEFEIPSETGGRATYRVVSSRTVVSEYSGWMASYLTVEEVIDTKWSVSMEESTRST